MTTTGAFLVTAPQPGVMDAGGDDVPADRAHEDLAGSWLVRCSLPGDQRLIRNRPSRLRLKTIRRLFNPLIHDTLRVKSSRRWLNGRR
jgi:hypothetical protein